MQVKTKGIMNTISWRSEKDVLYIEGKGEMKKIGYAKEWAQIAKEVIKIVIEDGITSFDFRILKDLTILEEIQFPASFAKFQGLNTVSPEKLLVISVDKKNNNFRSENGVLFDKEKTELIFCSRTKRGVYNIPESVKIIDDFAFENCRSLEQVIIPESVTKIGDSAFKDCRGLNEIHIPDSITEIGRSTFWFCIGLEKIQIPESVTKIGDSAFFYCDNLKEISIPNSVITIDNNVFTHCGNLKKIIIPDSVKWIGKEVFDYCENLREVYISKNIRLIGENCFRSCNKLQKLVIGNTLPCPVYDTLGIDQEICTLSVPEKSVETYKKDSYWMNFKNILPIKIDHNNVQASIGVYLEHIKQNKSDISVELENLSIEKLEEIITKTDWWASLEDMKNDSEYEVYQQFCNLLFQSRKHKLDKHFIYDQNNIEKIVILNRSFKECCAQLKEEVEEAYNRLDNKKRSSKTDLAFCLSGGIYIHNSHVKQNLSCGPITPKYIGDDSLHFEIKDKEEIGNFPIFNLENNYADLINEEVIQLRNEGIGFVFYHYYSKSYLSLSDILEIDLIRGIWGCSLEMKR